MVRRCMQAYDEKWERELRIENNIQPPPRLTTPHSNGRKNRALTHSKYEIRRRTEKNPGKIQKLKNGTT